MRMWSIVAKHTLKFLTRVFTCVTLATLGQDWQQLACLTKYSRHALMKSQSIYLFATCTPTKGECIFVGMGFVKLGILQFRLGKILQNWHVQIRT